MAETSELFPSSRWMTYNAAAERLGLTPGLVAARARRRRWPTRICSDTGEAEVEVPAALLDIDSNAVQLVSDSPLRERVAQAVGHVNRREATCAREKAFAEERAIVKERAAAPKRPWWLGGWIPIDGWASGARPGGSKRSRSVRSGLSLPRQDPVTTWWRHCLATGRALPAG